MNTIHATPATTCQILVDDAGTVTCRRHPLVDTGVGPWPPTVEHSGVLCAVCVVGLVPVWPGAEAEHPRLCYSCDVVDQTVARSIGQTRALVAADVPGEHTRAEAARIVADLESRGVERIELDTSGMTRWRDRVAPDWPLASGPWFTHADWAGPGGLGVERSVRAYTRLVLDHAHWVGEAQPLLLNDPGWVEAQHTGTNLTEVK